MLNDMVYYRRGKELRENKKGFQITAVTRKPLSNPENRLKQAPKAPPLDHRSKITGQRE